MLGSLREQLLQVHDYSMMDVDVGGILTAAPVAPFAGVWLLN